MGCGACLGELARQSRSAVPPSKAAKAQIFFFGLSLVVKSPNFSWTCRSPSHVFCNTQPTISFVPHSYLSWIDPKAHTFFIYTLLVPFIEVVLRSEKSRAFLKVTHCFSSRGGLGTQMSCYSVKATLRVVQETKELICLASVGSGHGACRHNSIYYFVDVKNNRRINNNEN